MYEKVSKHHPDKVADRVAGAIVDQCYTQAEGGWLKSNPRVAVEVLIGHTEGLVIIETSEPPAPFLWQKTRMAYLRAVLKGEDVSGFHFKGEITEPHEGFRKWMMENEERIENARSLPYWMRDNGKYVKGAVTEPQPTVAMGGKDVHDQLDTSSTTIKNNLRVRDTMDMSGFNVKDTFPNGGKILVHELVSSDDSDYEKLIEVATFFAAAGKEVRLTPKMKRPPQFEYVSIYGSLVGTQYEHKCPDLLVDDLWYEHEGFITDNAKRAFGNMMNHGLKQSDRLVIDLPNLTVAYMKRIIHQRVKDGQAITEVWTKDGNNFRLIYKKSEE